jgi:hypothetical protein
MKASDHEPRSPSYRLKPTVRSYGSDEGFRLCVLMSDSLSCAPVRSYGSDEGFRQSSDNPSTPTEAMKASDTIEDRGGQRESTRQLLRKRGFRPRGRGPNPLRKR